MNTGFFAIDLARRSELAHTGTQEPRQPTRTVLGKRKPKIVPTKSTSGHIPTIPVFTIDRVRAQRGLAKIC